MLIQVGLLLQGLNLTTSTKAPPSPQRCDSSGLSEACCSVHCSLLHEAAQNWSSVRRKGRRLPKPSTPSKPWAGMAFRKHLSSGRTGSRGLGSSRIINQGWGDCAAVTACNPNTPVASFNQFQAESGLSLIVPPSMHVTHTNIQTKCPYM